MISVVIPVYNEELYILRAIDCVVQADTLGLQKEIIIVDDGSTDRTHDILKKNIEYRIQNIRKNKHNKQETMQWKSSQIPSRAR